MAFKARIENGIVYSPYPSEAVPELPLYQVVKQSLEQHGDRIALVCEDKEITSAELLKMFQRYAAGFQLNGIKKGDKVLVHLENSLENLIAMYSIIFAGGIAVLSFPVFNNDDILYKIRDSNASYIFTSEIEAKKMRDFRNKFNIKGYFATGIAEGFVSVSEFKNLNENTYRKVPVEDVKNEAVMLVYSSGTTGRPKAIEHTHYSIVARLSPKCHHLFNDEDIVASQLPITMSLGFKLHLCAFYTGAKSVMFLDTAGTGQMIDDIRKYEVTTVVERYRTILKVAKEVEKKGVPLNCLKKAIFTGVYATFQTYREFEQYFGSACLKNAYATNEIGWICQPPMNDSKWYGIGFPAPMSQIKIVDIVSGKVLGPNEQGELIVKTPSSMRGYYGNPEATSKTVTPDGWVRTGDICYYNEDGQFFFVERIKQLFRCDGILVAPSSIERVLTSHEGIAEAAVIGVPHPKYLEAAMAFVVLKPSYQKLAEEEIKNFVAGQLAAHMYLHGGLKFVHALPKDANSKVLRRKLLESFQDV